MRQTKKFKLITIVVAVLCAMGCVTPEPNEVVKEKFYSPSIAENLLGENPEQEFTIYLPPGYYQSDESYPVIYFLHGFGEIHGYSLFERKFLDEGMLNETMKKFIIVEPNGNSSLGGSFYWNSPVNGNWEDYIVKDLVGHIDENYRTIAKKEGRGLAGFSMGGTGAINIAFKHPDIFNALYSFSAGVLRDGDMDLLLGKWDGYDEYENSYGAAISPDTSLEAPYAEIPNRTFEKGSDENNRVISNWYKLFGDQATKLDRYMDNDAKLSGIKIDYSGSDWFTFISYGNADLVSLLEERGIEHEVVKSSLGHSLPSRFVTNNLVPYFTEHLE